MKLNKSRQLLLAAAVSLLAASLLTACATLTVDFVFVSSAKAAGTSNYGEIDVFEVNSESGFMRQIPTSPFPSGGRNPVAEAVSTDYNNLYVVNRDDNTIVQFIIGNDGKLYAQSTTNTPGVFPMAVGVTASTLFVVDSYQPLPICSSAAPCSGSVGVFPIAAATSSAAGGGLGSQVANGTITYWPLCLSGYTQSATTATWGCTSAEPDVIAPTGISVLKSGSTIYVSAYDATASPNKGYIFGFTFTSAGVLTPINSGAAPIAAGVHPSSIVRDPTGAYLYVTDYTAGTVLGFTLASGSPVALSSSPFVAGDEPTALVIDPTGKYAYVANSLDSTITSYSVSAGQLTRLGSYPVGTEPVAIAIDPSTSHFLYTANYLGSNVSGFELSLTDGSLVNSQNSPYVSNALPTAIASIPHGSSTTTK